MAANDRNKRSKFVQIDHWVMNCEAWKKLSPDARSLFLELKKRYNGYNNGEIGFGVREAGKSINRNFKTVGKYLRELQKKGFIVATYAATFSNSKGKRATEWEITDVPLPHTKQAKKLFMKWNSNNDDFPVARRSESNS